MNPSRMRRVVRWLRWPLRALALLLVLLLILLHTGWGRDFVRAQIESAASEAMPGSLRIAALEGSILGEPTLKGIALLDAKESPILSAESLKLDLSLLDLWANQVSISNLDIDGLALDLKLDDTGNLNLLQALTDPNAPPSDTEWQVSLKGIDIRNSSLRYTDSQGTSARLDELNIQDLSVEVRGGTTIIGLGRLDAISPLCGLKLHAEGEVRLSEDRIESSSLLLSLGESRVTLEDLLLSEREQSLHAKLEGELSPELLKCLAPQEKWLSKIAMVAEAERKPGEDRIALSLDLGDGALQLSDATVASDFGSASASILLKDFEPGKFVELDAQIFASGHVDLKSASLDPSDLQAEVRGALDAQVDGYKFEIPALSVVAKDRSASMELDLAGYGATATARATIDWKKSPLNITRGSLSANVPELSELPLAIPAAGALELYETGFSGSLASLQVTGKLKGRHLHYEQTRVRQVGADFGFEDILGSVAGKVTLKAQGVRQGSQPIGPVVAGITSDAEGKVFDLYLEAGQSKLLAASLRARAVRGDAKTELHLRKLDLRHKALSAQLRPSGQPHPQLTIWEGGNLSVDDLRLALSGGTITIDGSLDSEVKARIKNLRVAPLLALAPALTLPITASFSGSATASRSESGISARASLKSEALRLTPESEALRTEIEASMSPTTLSASVSLESDERGRMHFQGSIRPPEGRWTQSAGRLLRPSRLAFEQFDLRLLRPLHEDLASLGGQVNGAIDVGAGAKAIHGTLLATELVHKAWSSKRGGSVTIDATPKKASIDLVLSDSKIGDANAHLEIFPPGPLHSLWRWPRSLTGVLGDSDLSFDKLDLVALQSELALQGQEAVEGGLLSGSLKLRNKGKTLKLSLDAHDLQIHGRPKLAAHLETTHTPSSTTGRWDLIIDPKNGIRGGVTIDLGLSALRHHRNPDRLVELAKLAKLRGSASLESNSPALLARMADVTSDVVVSGTIVAGATIQGTIADPRGSLQINIANAKVDGVPLQRVSFSGEQRSDGATASLRVYQGRDRFLSAGIDFDTAQKRLRSGAIEAKNIDLRLLRALDKSGEGMLASLAGVANGKLKLAGDWEHPELTGTIRVSDGAIDLGGSFMPLVGLALKLDADDKRLILEGKGNSGSGRIKVSGQARLAGRELTDVAVQLRSTKLPVLVASLVCSVDLDTHSQISWQPGLVDIRTQIDSALVRVPIRGFAAETRSLHSIDGMSDLVYVSPETKESAPTLEDSGTKVRIRVRANESVMVQTRELQAKVDLDLTATIDSGIPFIHGDAHVAAGHIDLFERRYTIEKASANFNGRVPMNPSFDIRLRHDFDQLSLTILGQGDLDDKKFSFVADPPNYDQATLLAIVLGQAPAQEEDQQGLRNNALSALSTYAARQIKEMLGPLLPFDLDVMRVEKGDIEGEYLYVTGRWINDNWYVGYRHHTTTDELENTNEIESKYKLSKAWAVEAAVGDAEKGIDVLWTKRWGK